MSADNITEADVIAWLRRKVIDISQRTRATDCSVQLSVFITPSTSFCNAYVHAGGGCGMGYDDNFAPVLEVAIGDLFARIGSPEVLAAEKREQARKLMAEAETLCPGSTVIAKEAA